MKRPADGWESLDWIEVIPGSPKLRVHGHVESNTADVGVDTLAAYPGDAVAFRMLVDALALVPDGDMATDRSLVALLLGASAQVDALQARQRKAGAASRPTRRHPRRAEAVSIARGIWRSRPLLTPEALADVVVTRMGGADVPASRVIARWLREFILAQTQKDSL